MFSVRIFLRVVGVIALTGVVDYLFRSHVLNVVVNVVVESVSVFSFKKDMNI